MFGRLAGYGDVDNADRLTCDPAMRWIVGGKAVERDAASTGKAFAKLKAFLRKAAARTCDTLSQAFADAISRFKTAEFQNYFCVAVYPR